MRFFGEGARYVEREDGHSPDYPEVSAVLSHGEPLLHPRFPQVYPRPADHYTRAR
jgi:hypothetical protein